MVAMELGYKTIICEECGGPVFLEREVFEVLTPNCRRILKECPKCGNWIEIENPRVEKKRDV